MGNVYAAREELEGLREQRAYALNLHWAIALAVALVGGGLGMGWLYLKRRRS